MNDKKKSVTRIVVVVGVLVVIGGVVVAWQMDKASSLQKQRLQMESEEIKRSHERKVKEMDRELRELGITEQDMERLDKAAKAEGLK